MTTDNFVGTIKVYRIWTITSLTNSMPAGEFVTREDAMQAAALLYRNTRIRTVQVEEVEIYE